MVTDLGQRGLGLQRSSGGVTYQAGGPRFYLTLKLKITEPSEIGLQTQLP